MSLVYFESRHLAEACSQNASAFNMEGNVDFVIDMEFNLSDEENQDAETPELDINGSEIQSESSELNIDTRIHLGPSELNLDTDPGIDHSESSELNLDTKIRFESIPELNIDIQILSESPELNNNTSIPSESILPGRICGVPQRIREDNERAYRPRIVSIGPFHYKKPGLESMEVLKEKFLRRMLEENDKQDLLPSLHGAMKKLEIKTRKCYLDVFNTISSDDFVKMMLVDGCFIIELFRLNDKKGQGQVVKDPIFAAKWIVPDLRQDLLMLENQLPFFVLHEIFRLAGYSEEDGSSLNRLALQFFKSAWPSQDKMPIESCNIEGSYQHLLALFQSSFISSDYQPETTSSSSFLSSNLPLKGWVRNAERLKQAGLRLEKISGNLSDMELQRSRLKIPTLFIGSRTEPVLRNLVAYEQYNSHVAPYFTSLVLLFYSLVDTPEDVMLLQQKGIIRRTARSGEEVVALFSSLSRDIVLDLDDCLITKQVEDINRYCQTFRAKIFTVVHCRFFRNIVKVVISSIFLYLAYKYLHLQVKRL